MLWPSVNAMEKQQGVVNGTCKHNGEFFYIHAKIISVNMISTSQYENMALISPEFIPMQQTNAIIYRSNHR